MTAAPSSFAIGIDLGTTYCCVAVLRHQSHEAEIIPNEMGKNTTPSYVAYTFEDENDVYAGETAKDLAFDNPENTVFDIKRLIGRTFYDPHIQRYNHLWPFHLVNIPGLVGVKIGGQPLLPQIIATELISHLKKTAENYLNCSIDSAVVTIPVYYNDLQQGVTREACSTAGLTQIHFIREPVAAAVAYGLQSSPIESGKTKTCLIFDLGGGTFDVTIFTLDSEKQVKIQAVGGDDRLGGEDFNDLLTEYCINDFKTKHGIDLASGKNSEDVKVRKNVVRKLRRVRNECEKQKRFLSSTTEIVVSLDGLHPDFPMAVPITRKIFEDLIGGHLTRCMETLDGMLRKTGFKKGDIDDVILIGGSSRIPKVQEMLGQYFEGKRLHRSIDADEAVACGAAIYACNLFHGQSSAARVTLLNMEEKPKSLEILSATKKGGFEINVEAFKPVLDKVGDRKFILYSINGVTRTGKSYVLNHFIKYFEARKVHGDGADWKNFKPDSTFISRGGRERVTKGIHLWSEPYFVKGKNGEEVAIILMDSQGLFDEYTTVFQNAFIMSISTLCSSVMIFNAMRLLNEDVLQHFQLFSNYASTVMNQDEEPDVVVSVNETSIQSVHLEVETNKKSCQKLFFLMRDFELADYSYGLHDDNGKPEGSRKNFFKDTFRVEGRPDCPEENKSVRKNILGNYRQVSVYTLPDPGKKFKRQEEGKNIPPNDDFSDTLHSFVEFVVSEENLVVKQFGALDVTGNDFLEYVTQWAAICKNTTEEKFPSAQTMAQSTAWTRYAIVHGHGLREYRKLMDESTSSVKTGVSEDLLQRWQLTATDSAMKLFNRQKKIENIKFDLEFSAKLINDMLSCFNSNYKALNQKRLEIEKLFNSNLKELKALHSNLSEGVKGLEDKLKKGEFKRSEVPAVEEHLAAAREFLKDDKVMRLNFKISDNVPQMIERVNKLKKTNEKLLNSQKIWCSFL